MFKRGILMLCVLWVDASLADPVYLPKPPTFDINTNPESALDDYPLGAITPQIAFSYHGGRYKKILLTNGKQGQVYMLGYARNRKT